MSGEGSRVGAIESGLTTTGLPAVRYTPSAPMLLLAPSDARGMALELLGHAFMAGFRSALNAVLAQRGWSPEEITDVFVDLDTHIHESVS